MRIEFDERDSGPKYGYLVRLDGQICQLVQMFDTELGVVEAALIDKSGLPIFDLELEEWLIVQKWGRVTAEPLHEVLSWTPTQLQEIIRNSPFSIENETSERGFAYGQRGGVGCEE